MVLSVCMFVVRKLNMKSTFLIIFQIHNIVHYRQDVVQHISRTYSSYNWNSTPIEQKLLILPLFTLATNILLSVSMSLTVSDTSYE